jgi:hypothetical protein
VILTKTHLIAFCLLSPNMTLVRAFIVAESLSPAPARATVDELCLTHEAHMGELLLPILLIRDSVFDTITRSTNLRFLIGSYNNTGQTDYRCLDLTLPESTAGEVMPMSIHSQDLFAVDRDSNPALAGGSVDGHIRGFVSILDRGHHDLYPPENDDLYPPEDVVTIQKFTIDASQERCTAVLGEPTQVTFPENLGDFSAESSEFHFPLGCPMYGEFDAVRGRLCYDIDDGNRLNRIVFFDLE